MLYGITPSIEVSGGPWYTDNELDTSFIQELAMACLRFIQQKVSFFGPLLREGCNPT